MADLIVVCPRRPDLPAGEDRLRGAALRLAPPELPLREPLLLESDGVSAAVANPTTEGVRLREGGVWLGGLFGEPGSWWQVGGSRPEGTYALVRWDADKVEVEVDICATRTLWYTLADDAFLVSTSQRALVALLGSFELLPEATAGFMATGSPGPGLSWDARLHPVPSDTRVTLDRAAWRVREDQAPYVLEVAPGDADDHVRRLREAMATTLGTLNADLDRWVLTISGGLDSRALLAFLVEAGVRPRCVTWTTRASLRNPLSDASIARRVARHYGVDHEPLILDDADADPDTILSRFVAADEGRNDEMAGYLDGFALWRRLTLAGVEGMVRGDQSMGGRWRPRSVQDVRYANAGATPDDYPDGHLLRRLGLAKQHWPERLALHSGERLADYGVRLEQQCCIPVFLAGLNEAKARYMEVLNPLLSREIIGVIRSLPPELSDRAQAYTRIVHGLDRTIPYARFVSTRPLSDFLGSPEFLELAVRELASPATERVLPGDGALRVLTAMTMTAPQESARDRLRSLVKEAHILLPYRLADRLYPGWAGPESLAPVDLAFRTLLATRTIAMFEEDARALAAIGTPAPQRKRRRAKPVAD